MSGRLDDPDRRAAVDFGHTTDIVENGKVVGQCHSWFLEDKQEAVNIMEHHNGEWSCLIEGFALGDE